MSLNEFARVITTDINATEDENQKDVILLECNLIVINN